MISDFDLTIVDSIDAFCKAYNYHFMFEDGFKKADGSKVQKYDFSDECPIVMQKYGKKGIQTLFICDKFFENLNFIDEYTYDTLRELSEKYKITICTIGTHHNIAKKVIWLRNHLSFINNIVSIVNDGCKMDKSIINMENAIFVEDHIDNLISSNAKRPIMFAPKQYEWNRAWGGEKVKNWLELKSIL